MESPSVTSDHWISQLSQYKNHVLDEILKEFDGDIRRFLLSSYIYMGEIRNYQNKIKKIVIVHYHTSLNGPFKFFDMQNLSSYDEIENISKNNVFYLSEVITSETVTLLAFPNALNFSTLKAIEDSHIVVLCNEHGKVTEYDI